MNKLPVVRADLEKRRTTVMRELHSVLRPRVSSLIEFLGGRFTVYTGYRDADAQAKAFASGNSAARFGQSPHNHSPALACDVVLDPDHVNVSVTEIDGDEWPNLWCTSTPEAVQAWQDLEVAAKRFNLRRVDVNGKRDRPHLELPNWKIYVVR